MVFVAVQEEVRPQSLHDPIWKAYEAYASNSSAYYHPSNWVPHITLAHGEERNSVPLPEGVVDDVLRTLKSENFRWTVFIANLALVWDDGTLQKPGRTFP